MASPYIPQNLTADLPATLWGKVLASTPVVMTVIATALAGLSSNEMNRGQYDRALGAQLQAKASDQWSFFQGKRLRSVLQSDVAAMLATEHGGSADGAPAQRFTFRTKSAVPEMPEPIQQAIQALAAGKPDAQIDAAVARISDQDLEAARRLALQRGQDLGREVESVDEGRLTPEDRLRFGSARYDAEADLDQDVAYLYELLVRKSNLEARGHHERSQLFFVGMLVSQVAVMISIFSLATRRRHVLWSIAIAAGVAALVYSLYVYFSVSVGG